MSSPEEIHIPVSLLDYIPPRNYVRLLFPLALKPAVEYGVVFRDLQLALHKTFVQEPWASGKVFRRTNPDVPGQLEIRFLSVYHEEGADQGPRQLRYHELETDWSYTELQESGFPTDAFPDEEQFLFDAPRVGDVDGGGADIFLAQANFLPGGLFLAVTTSHAATDAAGMLDLVKLWAENFRELHGRDAGGVVAPSPFDARDRDRGLPERPWSQGEKEGVQRRNDGDDPWLRALVSLDSDFPGEFAPGHSATASREDGRGRMLNRVLFLSGQDLAALQTECAAEPLPPGEGALSASDAVNAFLWRGLLRARAAAAEARGAALADELSVFESPVDVRGLWAPDFPAHYLGNCFLLNTARLPLADLIASSTGLGRIARALRSGAGSLDQTAAHAAYGLLRSVGDVSRVRGRFVERMDSADLLVSNVMFFSMEDLNFGDRYFGNGGVAHRLRVLHAQYADSVRLAHILPRNPNHGGVELSVNLFEDEMPYLEEDEEFNRYVVPIEV
ncbi:hypothetical protein P170DRAFT_435094 [Aspergillus steynii IBT 23096]|uniref:Trichothecene 3-O-acetyltransferase-like N-terminal domain-containing protein n=1 Tax=Aspergillus steynii IBT 23096 TaxID=1392250 RepID=A0A2I2GKP7_9EURO|nr:uncharacterized protein P170DRAFT_435094 [Aspergillus steynii IBT 23096]PLB53463.1 hypothetical protein P170DRAFT_435094 [Aspergillus steynii IBT 23096]